MFRIGECLLVVTLHCKTTQCGSICYLFSECSAYDKVSMNEMYNTMRSPVRCNFHTQWL